MKKILQCNLRTQCKIVAYRFCDDLTVDTRKIFVDEFNSVRVFVGCKPTSEDQ